MNAKERTLYFAAVCLMLFSLGILLLAFAHKAHAAGPVTVPVTYTPETSAGAGFATYTVAIPVTGYGSFFFAASSSAIVNPFISAGSTHTLSAAATSTLNTFGPGTFVFYGCYAVGCPLDGSGSVIPASSDFTWSIVYNPDGSVSVPTGGNTQITLTQPTQATSTGSTTLNLSADYLIGDDLSTFSLNGSLPDRIGVEFFIQNNTTNQQTIVGPDFSVASTTNTLLSYSTTTVLMQGDYTVFASLVGDYGFTPAPAGCTPIPPFSTCTGSTNISTIVNSAPPVVFSLDNGTLPYLGFQVGSTTSRNGLATTTCSITAIGGCFQNALAFLFYPSPDALSQFQFLWTNIQNKPPFGYVSQTIAGLRAINASSTPAFSFGDIPLMSAFFTPFRTGLASILWLGFFITWYRGRLRHLDI